MIRFIAGIKGGYVYTEVLFKYLLCANNVVILALMLKNSRFNDEWDVN
jgi:hypothetical protein